MKDTRLRLMLDYPFFGNIALSVDLKESKITDTMSTDSKNIFYNPDFVATLSPSDKLYIYQHEICHIILGHSFRREDRDFVTWNIAGDYAINLMLTEMLQKPVPAGGLYKLKYKGWSTEQIYEDVYDEFQEQIKESASNTQPGPADPNAKPGPSAPADPNAQPDPNAPADPNAKPDPNAQTQPAPINLKQEEFDKMVEQAKKHGLVEDASDEIEEYEIESKVNMADQVTNGAGIEEGSMIRDIITEMTSTDVAWRELLARFVNQSCDSYYDWMVPSQRYSFGDIIMPSLSSKSSLKLAVVIDTSGSIDNILLKTFMSEFKSLIASVEYEELYMLSCDTKVHRPQRYSKHETIDYIPKGGGGTYFYPAWEHFKEEGFTPDCLIYFTDLDVSDYHFGKDPGYPVLFIGDFWDKYKTIPFGEKADIKRAA